MNPRPWVYSFGVINVVKDWWMRFRLQVYDAECSESLEGAGSDESTHWAAYAAAGLAVGAVVAGVAVWAYHGRRKGYRDARKNQDFENNI